MQLYTCDCSIRVTAVLEYLKSAFHYQGVCYYFIVLAYNNNGVCHNDRLLRGTVLVLNRYQPDCIN